MIFLTPSYHGDLQRFLLMRKSLRRFCLTPMQHLVVVNKRDANMFAEAVTNDPAVKVLIAESYVDRSFYPQLWYRVLRRTFPKQARRFTHCGGRAGWFTQQIVKLASPQITNEATVIVVDSDLVFIREFDERTFAADSGGQMLARIDTEPGNHGAFLEKARALLKLPPGTAECHYMSHPAVLQTEWLRSLHGYLEQLYGQGWQRTLFEAEAHSDWWLSEYCLYGTYVEEILKPANLHIRTAPFAIGVWTTDDMPGIDDILERADRIRRYEPHSEDPICLVVQSSLHMPVEEYSERLLSLME